MPHQHHATVLAEQQRGGGDLRTGHTFLLAYR